MTAIAVISRRGIEGISGTVVDPADVAALTFHPDTDTWTVAGPHGGFDHALIVVDAADAAGLELRVPALDPRISPPTALSGPAYLGMLFDGVPNLVVLDPESSEQLAVLRTWVEWMDEEGVQRNIRALSRRGDSRVTSYGTAQGYLPLRDQVSLKLLELGIGARSTWF